MSNFTVTLTEPYNELIKKMIEEQGYEITYITKLKPDLIFVNKTNGNAEELLTVPKVKSARLSNIYKLI